MIWTSSSGKAAPVDAWMRFKPWRSYDRCRPNRSLKASSGMEVYIFRHAKANFGSKDRDPPVTAEGEAEAQGVMELASRSFGFKPTVVASSPVLRAKQTAELARRRFGLKSVVVDECLYGDAKPAEVLKFLSKLRREDRVVLVSHVPLIFELLHVLIGGRGEVELLNGSMAAASFKGKAAAGKGKLMWLIQPGV